jgi:hypothetical protein
MFFYKSPIKIKPQTFRLVNFLGKSPTRKKDTLGDQKRAPVEMEMAPFPQVSSTGCLFTESRWVLHLDPSPMRQSAENKHTTDYMSEEYGSLG